jgi:Lrp/AsnC family leucine-responsive transcriptional regulator
MDAKDRLLLTLLRRDARRSIVALARDLGLSRSATQERLAKLRMSGAIGGFTVIEGAKGAADHTAHLLVRFQAGKQCAQVVPKLTKIPAIAAIHSVAGTIDLMVRVEAATMPEIEAARAAVVATPGVAEVTTFIVLERHLA